MNIQSSIIIVDVETDGLDPFTANIMEIGIAELYLDIGRASLLLDTTICPPGPETWLKCWFMTHSGIKPDEIRQSPNFESIKPIIKPMLSSAPVTAYNLNFDSVVLRQHDIILEDTLPCLMLTCTDILRIPGKYGYWKYPSFQEAWNYFFPNRPMQQQHRAGDDAMRAAELAMALYEKGFLKK